MESLLNIANRVDSSGPGLIVAENRLFKQFFLLSCPHHTIVGVWVLVIIVSAASQLFAQPPEKIMIGEFSSTRMKGWTPKKFENETRYQMIKMDNTAVIRADSRAAASGLVKKIRIDLDKYPFINWRWRIGNRLAGVYDERTKTGDDYAARIYIIASGGIAVWNTRALNYVWAKHAEKEAVWHNAYAGKRAVMTAVRSVEDPVSVWLTEKRNIKKDFETHFKKNIRYIDAVALMSDTDNTKNQVTAFYGDIFFSSE